MKKKLLIISLNIPYPLSHGGAIAQYYFLENLQHVLDITFITKIDSKADLENYNQLKNKLVDISFVAFDSIENKSMVNNFYIRFKNFVYKYLKLFVNDEKQNLEVFRPFVDIQFKSFLFDFSKKNEFDIIQFEFFESLPYANVFSDSLVKIFVHHEIRFKARFQQCINSREYLDSLMHYELSELKKFSKIIVFNEEDQLLLNSNGLQNIIVSKYSIPSLQIMKNDVSNYFDKFIFVGNQSHYPNLEGLEWFLDFIYLSNYENIVPIYITGNWNEEFKYKYDKYDKIIFTGFVNSLNMYFENAVLLCPIISGSGLRTKILEAFANRVPVFSTTIGAEGLISDGGHLVLFDEKNFVSQYNKNFNLARLNSIATLAHEYFKNNFDSEDLIKSRLKVYEI